MDDQYCVGSNALLQFHQATVSRTLASVSKLICEVITAKYVKFPQTEAELSAAKDDFYRKHNIPGCVGIVDGTHIRVSRVPREGEAAYRNRKNIYSINTMIICSANLQIIGVNARYPGSCHDSYVFRCSEVNRFLQQLFEEKSEFNYATNPAQWTFLLADLGYALQPRLMRPYDDDCGSEVLKNFNAKSRSVRSNIERLNGILKNTFRCLHSDRTLKYSHQKSANIIYACCGIYNFMKHRNYIFCIDDAELHQEMQHTPPLAKTSDPSDSFSNITAVRIREKLAQILRGH